MFRFRIRANLTHKSAIEVLGRLRFEIDPAWFKSEACDEVHYKISSNVYAKSWLKTWKKCPRIGGRIAIVMRTKYNECRSQQMKDYKHGCTMWRQIYLEVTALAMCSMNVMYQMMVHSCCTEVFGFLKALRTWHAP